MHRNMHVVCQGSDNRCVILAANYVLYYIYVYVLYMFICELEMVNACSKKDFWKESWKQQDQENKTGCN